LALIGWTWTAAEFPREAVIKGVITGGSTTWRRTLAVEAADWSTARRTRVAKLRA